MSAHNLKQNKGAGRMALLVLAAGLAWTATAQAQTKPFGQPIDGWVFTATTERPGVVNCRAQRKAGGRDDILALRNDWKGYFSINAEGRKGKWPRSVVNLPGRPGKRMEWTSTAEANGLRLWFPLEKGALDEIFNAGAFEWSLMDSEDDGKFNVGRRGGEVWERVNQCVLANGG